MAWKTRPMTKAVRTKQSGGFTLIEIVMVLAIAAVIMGGAVGLMVLSSDERVLRNVSGEVEALAIVVPCSAPQHGDFEVTLHLKPERAATEPEGQIRLIFRIFD